MVQYYSTMLQCFSYFYSRPTIACHNSNIYNNDISNMSFPYLLGFSEMLLGQKVWACGGFKKLDYFFLGFPFPWNKLTKSSLPFVELPQIPLSSSKSTPYSSFIWWICNSPTYTFLLNLQTILMFNCRPIENFQL